MPEARIAETATRRIAQQEFERFPLACGLHFRVLVGARAFTELAAWRAADRLRRFILENTTSGPAARDFKFKDQIRDAAEGTTRNLAEGFGRYSHGDFARFVNFAIGSATKWRTSFGRHN